MTQNLKNLAFGFIDLALGCLRIDCGLWTYSCFVKDFDYVMDYQVMFPSSLVHQVPEGHVGAYWRGGALLNIITEPGIYEYFYPCL